MSAEHKAEIQKIRDHATERAMEVIKKSMPRKVIELTALLTVRTTYFSRLERHLLYREVKSLHSLFESSSESPLQCHGL